jgi:hypothetical protein
MSEPHRPDPLAGTSDREREIMLRLLRTPRQPQKDANATALTWWKAGMQVVTQ